MRKLLVFTLTVLIALGTTAGVKAQNTDIVGTWEMTTNSPEGTSSNTMVISKDGETLKAVAKSERGERAYDRVELKGNSVTIVLTINYNGSPMVITYTGTLDKASMTGVADFGGLADGTWSASKKS